MPKTLEQQMEEIFGPARSSSQTEDALTRDLNSLVEMPEDVLNAVTDQIGKYVAAYQLTHSQLAAALLGVLASEAGHCQVANVITVQSLEQALRGLLDATAGRAGQDVVPLLKASIQRIVGDDAKVVHFDTMSGSAIVAGPVN